jgi:hypothetical protein
MRPHLLLLAAVIIWGWTFVATKILVAELGPVEIFGMRLAIGAPVLLGALLMRGIPLAFDSTDIRPLLLGGAIFTVHFLVQIAGLLTTTATNTGWIISVSPLVLAVLSFIVLGERSCREDASPISPGCGAPVTGWCWRRRSRGRPTPSRRAISSVAATRSPSPSGSCWLRRSSPACCS